MDERILPLAKIPAKLSSKDLPAAQLEGRSRVIIESVSPQIEHGQFAIHRVMGETVAVEADIFADGHDTVSAQLLVRGNAERNWRAIPMKPLGNDRWQAQFSVTNLGECKYTIEAWIDSFATWRSAMKKRIEAKQETSVEREYGAILITAAAKRAKNSEAKRLLSFATKVREDASGVSALDPTLEALMQTHAEHAYCTRYSRELSVFVDRKRARFSAWYELFPRSCSPTPGEHGTFKDVENMLPYVAAMNFDVLYLPPIHPIGTTFRKGKNNAEKAEPGDVGSPWAIGSPEGGHKAIHPQLGTLDDFHSLVAKTREHGMEIALDLAFQCSPDHPYVTEHPSFFRTRPDGTIQYAENPPKKYQDIYPLNFETDDWRTLWGELKSVIVYWIDQGVEIFRVDNPHTKAFPFWKWVIAEVKIKYPQVIFLAEAFTRPKVMHQLAKAGFTQSYSYFTWRNTKEELTEYMEELTQTEVAEFFSPNFWPTTPDILPECLQIGGRPAFMSRYQLAATLNSNYGIYGPSYELCDNKAIAPGSEDALDSEKYQLRHWNLDDASSLRTLIARVNQIRRDHPALQQNQTIRFHKTDQDFLLAYSKTDAASGDSILVVVNLHHEHKQSGWVDLDLEVLGLAADQNFEAHDLLTDFRFSWKGARNYIELDPGRAHIFHLPSIKHEHLK